MKTKMIAMVLIALPLGVFSAPIAAAKSAPAGTSSLTKATTQQMMLEKDPNHVLAAAYHQNLVVFADALHGQAAGANSVNVPFARAAVIEMRRGFDQMTKYHQEYMKTITLEVRGDTAPTMRQLETQRDDLDTKLTALEKEVALGMPDAKKVASMTSGIHAQLDAMSLTHGSQSTR